MSHLKLYLAAIAVIALWLGGGALLDGPHDIEVMQMVAADAQVPR